MKIFVLIYQYFDGADFWENPWGHFQNPDLAEYIKIELSQLCDESYESFFIREVSLDSSGLEDYGPILEKCKEKFKHR